MRNRDEVKWKLIFTWQLHSPHDLLNSHHSTVASFIFLFLFLFLFLFFFAGALSASPAVGIGVFSISEMSVSSESAGLFLHLEGWLCGAASMLL